MIFKEEMIFKSSIEKVWDLLTNPAMTKEYMFGCEIISDWKVGSAIDWKGKTEDGQEVVYVTGKILEYQEMKKITSTTFDPNADMEDIPKNHVNLTYELDEVDGGTQLIITQGDFSEAENGANRYEESKNGWIDLVIPKMKELLKE